MKNKLPILQRRIDAEVKKAAQGSRVSCKKGCGSCCSQWVGVYYTEAVEAVAEAKRVGYKIDPNRLLRQLKIANDPETTRESWFLSAGPCVFLDATGSCGVYEKRPIACRLVLVGSPPEFCAKVDGIVAKVPTSDIAQIGYNDLKKENAAHGYGLGVFPLPVAVANVISGHHVSRIGMRNQIYGLNGETSDPYHKIEDGKGIGSTTDAATGSGDAPSPPSV